MYKQADAGWKLEKSASLAVLRSHRAGIEALLADVKYDKIAHVRQVAFCKHHMNWIPCHTSQGLAKGGGLSCRGFLTRHAVCSTALATLRVKVFTAHGLST